MGRYLTLVGVLATLGGCAAMVDPFQREGTYVSTGVNEDNLRAMIVNPVDLQHGTGPADTLGVTSATAVSRLRNDNVKALPDSTLSQIGSSAGTGGQGGGGGGGGATVGGTP